MKPKLPAVLLSLIAALVLAACTPLAPAPAPAPILAPAATSPAPVSQPAAEPLPSWNEGPTKTAILQFIAEVTDPNGPQFVPPADRIVVSDNDGTLWTERPILPQMAFVFARIQALAKDHPEWATTQPYAAILSGDEETIKAFTPEQVEELIYTTHAGMTQEEFESVVQDFLASALHPQFKAPYTQTVYQPLLELLSLLRANEFRPFIVSGGGADFVRAFAPAVYGIPTDDVVGSSLQYQFTQTSPITGDLVRLPEMVTFDDKEMKPVNIQHNIGKRPIMAIGNSDGDLAMFQYTGGGKLPFLNLLIVHDDAEREYAYTLGAEAAQTAAAQSPWLLASMKRDFKTVFPPGVPAAETQASNAGWSTYANPAGFSIQYPPTWKQAELPPAATAQGVSLDGPEGVVELWWGAGFGGACPEGYSTVKAAGGELPACHTVGADGSQHWEQINKELSATSFSGRAYTKDAAQASADAVLAILATLSFTEAAAETAAAATPAAIANPASQNCIALGGKLQIEEREDGEQFGVCYFEDNKQCEEWALMRRECPVGGVKVTGYVTPVGRYCAIRGGAYAVTANSGQPDEQGTCMLSSGVQCDATEFYAGKCDSSTGKMPPGNEPTASGLILVPPAAEVCNGMAQALSEAASRAHSKRAIMPATQADEPIPMTDPATGAEGTACRPEVTGTGEDFVDPDTVMKEITAVLTGGGWIEDEQLAAGGPTGIGSGFRSGDLVAMAVAMWLPDPAANCPKDQPISACQLTPAQQLYSITVDVAQTVKQATPIGMPNPASQNCVSQGGTLEIEERGDGGQFGVCYFEDNKQCEEWALQRGDCPLGGVKVTGYNTPAARYCAIAGGEYTPTGTTPDGAEAGNCLLPNGETCDVWAYYNGYCGASQ